MEPCKKCGSKMPPKIEWHEATATEGGRFFMVHTPRCPIKEHLHYTCRECGYNWTGPTKDQDEPSKYPESESAGKESLSHFHPTGYIFGDPIFYRGGKGGEVFWVDVDGELKKHKNWTVTGIENVKLNWKLASQDKEGDYRSRMDEEHAQLEERIGRLSEFICSDEYEDLPKEEKGDLAQQYKTMRKYAEVLSRRILRAQEVQ